MTAPLTLFRARSVITMDPTHPTGSAVLVDGDRIAAVGSFDELPTSDCVVDDTFAEAVLCAGFIDQHLHPVLGATTLMTDVIAIEDWTLPDQVGPAAHSQCSQQRGRRHHRLSGAATTQAITRKQCVLGTS